VKPDVAEVERIAGLPDPVIRNLQITECYSRLAAGVESEGANWCTFATWASKQAGQTIRGEDLLDMLRLELGRDAELLHPIDSLWRAILRRGLFDRSSRFGRLVWSLHTPFDALPLASDAVARGNRKVFAEIGLQFARYLTLEFETFMAGLQDPELRQAFTHLEQGRAVGDPQLVVLANLEVGLHEQTRLQPEIGEALDAPYVTGEELGRQLCGGHGPSLVHRAVGTVVAPVQGWMAELAREAITHSLMVLSVPGRILALGAHLPDPYPDVLRDLVNRDLEALIAGYEPVAPAVDDCGAHDWSDLQQRMHYIVHLFRAFHEQADLFDAPFTAAQVEQFRAGVIPEGDL
jgi:hypothetical protein